MTTDWTNPPEIETTVDGADATVVLDGTSPRLFIAPPTLDECMVRVIQARTVYAEADRAAKDANAEKKDAQDALNACIADAVAAYERGQNPEAQMVLGESGDA